MAMPGKLGLSIGAGNGDLFRHSLTLMAGGRWEDDRHRLRIDSESELLSNCQLANGAARIAAIQVGR